MALLKRAENIRPARRARRGAARPRACPGRDGRSPRPTTASPPGRRRWRAGPGPLPRRPHGHGSGPRASPSRRPCAPRPGLRDCRLFDELDDEELLGCCRGCPSRAVRARARSSSPRASPATASSWSPRGRVKVFVRQRTGGDAPAAGAGRRGLPGRDRGAVRAAPHRHRHHRQRRACSCAWTGSPWRPLCRAPPHARKGARGDRWPTALEQPRGAPAARAQPERRLTRAASAAPHSNTIARHAFPLHGPRASACCAPCADSACSCWATSCSTSSSGAGWRASPPRPRCRWWRSRARASTSAGRGNVAANLRALGGEAVLAGVVGEDAAGERVQEALREAGVVPALAVAEATRPTTVKTRIVAHHQQVVRADREVAEDVTGALEEALLACLREHLRLVRRRARLGLPEGRGHPAGDASSVREPARRRRIPRAGGPEGAPLRRATGRHRGHPEPARGRAGHRPPHPRRRRPRGRGRAPLEAHSAARPPSSPAASTA